MALKSSIVVSLGSAEGSAKFNVAIDGRKDGLNHGKTSFRVGDDVYFLVNKSSNVGPVTTLTSYGNLAVYGTATESIEEFIVIDSADPSSLQKVPQGSVNTTWIGTNLGLVTVNEGDVQLVNPPTGNFIGVLKCKYTAGYQTWKLFNTSMLDVNGDMVKELTIGTLWTADII